MWLNRYGGHSSPSSASPLPQRRPSHLAPTSSPQRPGLTSRSSSLSPLLTNGSTDSLPAEARQNNGSSLRYQLDASPSDVSDPLTVLRAILEPAPGIVVTDDKPSEEPQSTQDDTEDVDFGGLSLEEFVNASPNVVLEQADELSSHSFEECRSSY